MVVHAHTRQGEASELAAMARFATKGYLVSKPHSENSPYDFIVDTGKRLLRVQCKTGIVGKNTIRGDLSKRDSWTNTRTLYEASEVDLFAIYDNVHDELYTIPFKSVRGQKSVSLLLNPSARTRRTVRSKKAFRYRFK